MRAQRVGVPTAARGARRAARAKELDVGITYVDRQLKAGRMEYAEAIEQNYPIGTGITKAASLRRQEGRATCNHAVNVLRKRLQPICKHGLAPSLNKSVGAMRCAEGKSCIQCRIMVAHLSITLDEELYARLKRELPPKRLSAFISEAIRAKLRPDPKALDAAYQAAAKEGWRREVATDWAATEVDAWPE